MQSFMSIHFFVFKIQTIKNGFAYPESCRGFRETGPWTFYFGLPSITNAYFGFCRDAVCFSNFHLVESEKGKKTDILKGQYHKKCYHF